jgi:hypothetical protein
MKRASMLALLLVCACGDSYPPAPDTLEVRGTIVNRATATSNSFAKPGVVALLFAQFPPPPSSFAHALISQEHDLREPYAFTFDNITPFPFVLIAAGVDYTRFDQTVFNPIGLPFGGYPNNCAAFGGEPTVLPEETATTTYDVTLWDPITADPCFDACLLNPGLPFCGIACGIAASYPDPRVFADLTFCEAICNIAPEAPFCSP